jgi:hypothetical protein
MMLAAHRGPSAVHLRLRDCSCGDQASYTSLTQTVTVATHAILQTSGLKPPLAAKASIVLGTFSLAGLGDTDRAKKYSRH